MSESVRQAAQIMQSGGVIAYPTEGVWGLGCDPMNDAAVQTILDLKDRPADKGLILVAADMEQLSWLLEGLSEGELLQLQESWPGPNTWLVPHHNRLSNLLTGKFDTIALRVSAHPLVVELCAEFGGPVVSTSANSAGDPAAMSQSDVEDYFGDRLDYILPGALGGNAAPSTIRHLQSGEVIRAG